MSTPAISVILPVYNAEQYVDDAIRSILQQDYSDFEFIIANDGSTDDSLSKIKAHGDKRIRVIHNEKNSGLIDTLNMLLTECRGEFIARMDADDICDHSRLSTQLGYMKDHRTTGIVSAFMRDLQSNKIAGAHRFLESNQVKAALPFTNPIVHPAVMFRKSILGDALKYDRTFLHAEDYGLWITLLPLTEFGVIPLPLIQHRAHGDQMSTRHHAIQLEGIKKAQARLFGMLGIEYDSAEAELHFRLFVEKYPDDDIEFISKAESWLLKLIAANKTSGILPGKELGATCGEWWFRINQHFGKSGGSNYARYRKSPLAELHAPSAGSKAKLIFRSLRNLNKEKP